MQIINENGVSSRSFGAVVNGDHCSVYGNLSVINGNYCKVYGKGCIVNGNYCELYQEPSILNGHHCRILYRQRAPPSVVDEIFAPVIRQQEEERRREQERLHEIFAPVIRQQEEERRREQESLDRIFEELDWQNFSFGLPLELRKQGFGLPSAPPLDLGEQGFGLPSAPPLDLGEQLSKIEDVETEDESKACTICITNEKIIALPCGHRKTCASCTANLVKTKAPCPICRKEFKTFLRTFD